PPEPRTHPGRRAGGGGGASRRWPGAGGSRGSEQRGPAPAAAAGEEQTVAEAISVSGAVSGTSKSLAFETGKLAPQSQGAVVASIGDTMVLATANASKGVPEGTDFFPLTADVEKRMHAAANTPA